jgi:hypothetical protein
MKALRVLGAKRLDHRGSVYCYALNGNRYESGGRGDGPREPTERSFAALRTRILVGCSLFVGGGDVGDGEIPVG